MYISKLYFPTVDNHPGSLSLCDLNRATSIVMANTPVRLMKWNPVFIVKTIVITYKTMADVITLLFSSFGEDNIPREWK